MNLALHLPINSVSFGQVSSMILRVLYDREKAGNTDLDFCLFPIGGVDLSSQAVTEDFQRWVGSKIIKGLESHSKTTPLFKLWHLNGSLESYSNKQTLLTFYELDNPTKVELNIARNNKLCLSSQYACDVFKMFGIDASLIPLAFDKFNFKSTDKKYNTDERVVFNICGKMERRKHHAKSIQTWIKKYGNNTKFSLQCATFNPFLNDQQNNDMIRQILEGKEKPFNVHFYPMMKENAIYNDFLNSANIIIGMSGGEGWGLPEFHSIALGKHAVLLNAHSYKTWANDSLATLVQPNGKISAVDNIFFKQGEAFNQGQIFDWNTDEFINACETAVAKFQSNPINTAGLELQTKFSSDIFVDNVIKLSI